MIQGTMSNAGKSLLAAGLCRIFAQDGYKVAPFKSQNMALNSFITEEGLEMGRAQVMQAEAAGIKPSVYMNPILLKPTNDVGSQVIVNGEVLGTMSARDYFRYKKKLVPDILKAFHKLSEEYDIIVIEGAGSPAEINLKSEDIVNMGMAKMAHAPVLLVGDIDRGGVFAQLVGTVELLEKEERARIKGLIINKFRGDKSILDPGVVIGKGGSEIEKVKAEAQKLTSKKLIIDIKEVKRPDRDAQLVAENIALQLENRVSFRRAMKSTMGRSMKAGAKGIKTSVSGRLGGADMARTEFYSEGTIPLQTLRADIDYGFAEADTTYGKLGVKVWIYKGEVLPTKGNKEGSDK